MLPGAGTRAVSQVMALQANILALNAAQAIKGLITSSLVQVSARWARPFRDSARRHNRTWPW